jgi:hypothetical protein
MNETRHATLSSEKRVASRLPTITAQKEIVSSRLFPFCLIDSRNCSFSKVSSKLYFSFIGMNDTRQSRTQVAVVNHASAPNLLLPVVLWSHIFCFLGSVPDLIHCEQTCRDLYQSFGSIVLVPRTTTMPATTSSPCPIVNERASIMFPTT